MVTRSILTVDGLFMSLILLTLSGIFFLNAFLELHDRGFLAFLQKKQGGTSRRITAAGVQNDGLKTREKHGELPHFPAPSG